MKSPTSPSSSSRGKTAAKSPLWTEASPTQKQRPKPPTWRLSRHPQLPEERLSLDTVDLDKVHDELYSSEDEPASTRNSVDDPLVLEKARAFQALELVHEKKMSEARDIAEAALFANPANSPALFVQAAECESRQDWSEASRFYLVGIGHNSSDPNMEQGFQTNVDMLRAQRKRLFDRPVVSKWDDVLSFKPKVIVGRPPSPEDKPPWYRLGPIFEELLAEPVCHMRDLLEASQNPLNEAMELRRIIYQNLPFLNQVYAYYKQDLNAQLTSEDPLPGQVEHNGHDPCDDEDHMLLYGLWRILKESKVAMGNVKVKMPVAVFNRIHVQGKRRLARLQQDPSFDVSRQDPHARTLPVHFYDWIETLIRSAALKLPGSLSSRFEDLIRDFLRPFAMRKQVDKGFLEFSMPEIQAVLQEEYFLTKGPKMFDYFIHSYKATKIKKGTVGAKDLTMSFNHVFKMFDIMEAFDPNFTVKKLQEAFCKITCDSDLLPQEHPNNQNSEMVLDEFLDLCVRVCRMKKHPGDTPESAVKSYFMDELFYRTALVMPGKF